MTILQQLAPLYPEIAVALGAFAVMIWGVFRPETDGEGELAGWLAILVLGLGAWLILQQAPGAAQVYGGAFVTDDFARFMKLLVLAGSAFALILTFDDFRDGRTMKFEYPVLILLATVGMMIMISAGDLLSLYLGLELQSLAAYVIAAFRRDDVRSSEAGLKYFVLGALSSGMLLYGISLIYGFSGSIAFADIAKVATSQAVIQNPGLLFGLVFLMVGLAFKLSAVPFHMWTPDVYEGAPTPVTAFFATAPKVAAIALLARVVLQSLPAAGPQWQQIVVFLAIASMGLGAFAGIGQSNIKRLMAYSSIANVGFTLVGLVAASPEGTQGVLVYMAIYLAMTLGVFACILSMRRQSGPVEDIGELAGLAQTNLPMAFVLATLLFSLAGIPPLAGFFAKFYAFLPAIKAGYYSLAVFAVVASCVAAYYYLRIVKIMFFDEPKEAFLPVRARAGFVMAVTAFIMIAYVVVPAPLVDAAGFAARAFRY